MSAAQIATDEQIRSSIEAVTDDQAAEFVDNEEIAKRKAEARAARLDEAKARRLMVERLTESVARHVAGASEPSNFDAMVAVIERDIGPEPCPDCHGSGSRVLPAAVRATFQRRFDDATAESNQLLRQIYGAPPDEHTGQAEARDKVPTLIRLHENIRKELRTLNRRGICRRCRGAGYAPRRRGEETERADSMFTTVPCLGCRGSTVSEHEGLNGSKVFSRVYGASTGLKDGGACPRCAGKDPAYEDKGPGYRVPITIRPTLRTSEVLENPLGVDDLPDGFPRSDFERPLPADQGEAFLESIRERDPALALSVSLYLSRHGDDWEEHIWGRRFALWPITDTGRTTAAEIGTRGGYEGALEGLAAWRLEIAQGTRNGARGRILERTTNREARSLESRVKRALDVGAAIR